MIAKVEKIIVEPIFGTIGEVADYCVELANKYSTVVEFTFNGVELCVSENDSVKDVCRKYFSKIGGYE